MWLERMKTENGKLLGEIVGMEGSRSVREACRLSTLRTPIQRTVRSTVRLQLSEGKPTSPGEYLAAMGIDATVKNAHGVYEFDADGVRIVTPALVLAQTLFGSSSFPFLFRPYSIDLFCAPVLGEDGSASVKFWPGTVPPTMQYPSIIERFKWFYCFASARSCWASINAQARRGRFDITMPKARVEIVIGGVQIGNSIYATSAEILTLSTSEAPLPFATGQAREFAFHAGWGQFPRTAASDPQVLSRAGAWALSDDEWLELSPLFRELSSSAGRTQRNARLLVDAILEKQGAGIPWKKISCGDGKPVNAQVLYTRCVQDGRWEKIKAVIGRTRSEELKRKSPT